MNDAMAVKEGDCFIDVGEDGEYLVGGEVFFFLHELEQVPIQARFHDQVNILFVMEKPVQLDDVGMVEVHLDFNLS